MKRDNDRTDEDHERLKAAIAEAMAFARRLDLPFVSYLLEIALRASFDAARVPDRPDARSKERQERKHP